jgi:hypothetical protein
MKSGCYLFCSSAIALAQFVCLTHYLRVCFDFPEMMTICSSVEARVSIEPATVVNGNRPSESPAPVLASAFQDLSVDSVIRH